jgi:hypothetical protein
VNSKELRAMATWLLAQADAMDKAPATHAAPRATSSPRASTGAIASDSDLYSQYGDVEIRKDPPRWPGQSFKGSRMSQCPPEYLESLAGFLDWKSGKELEDADKLDGEEREKKLKYSGYSAKDAARARGWAARKTNARPAPASDHEEALAHEDGPPADERGFADDDIPFNDRPGL